MLQEYGHLNKPFFTWFFANMLGFGALGASLLIFPAIMSISNILVTFLIIAIPIALVQWIALRRILQTSILWNLTIPMGLALGIFIMKAIPDGLWQIVDDESIAALTAGYLVIGFAIGLPQWLILRRQLSKSSIWLLGSSIGVAAGFWIILVTDLIYLSGIIAYIVCALVYSITTGLTLTGLLAYRNPHRANLVNTT